MATYTPHYLLQFGGSLGNPDAEIWSCGIRLYSTNFDGFDEEGWFNGVGKTAPADWVTRPGSKIGSQVRLRWVKFNLINAAGHYDDSGNTREWIYPTPVTGGGGTSTSPFQVCAVLGWRTNAATRGRASKGRIYSPQPSAAVSGSTGMFVQADCLGMATSAALFLNTLDAGFGTGDTIRPHIMSGVDGSFNQIDTVVVDSVPDIQRRRGNALIGIESSAPVTY